MSDVENILPLVITTEQGNIVDVTLVNEKGYKKSIETGRLWFIHPKRGRLLPYGENTVFRSLTSQKKWYHAIIQKRGEEEAKTQAEGSFGGFRADESFSYLEAYEEREQQTSSAETEPRFQSQWEEGNPELTVFSSLIAVIRSRHRDRPEGSYTTHLFDSGIEKIKKKVGEEAVELLLSEEPQDVVHEAADLLYHLLVLLEARGISWDEVLLELAKRSG